MLLQYCFIFNKELFVLLKQITLCMERFLVLPFTLGIDTPSATLCSFQPISTHCFGLAVPQVPIALNDVAVSTCSQHARQQKQIVHHFPNKK